MPTDPTRAETPARSNRNVVASPEVEADPTRDPLDVLRLFRKPRGGDDLAVFGLTATRVEPQRRTSRML